MPEELGSRVAVNSEQIRTLGHELDRVRARVHKLESTLRGVELLREAVTELQSDMPNLARQAAHAAVEETLGKRWAMTGRILGLLFAAASAGAAVTAVLFSILTR